jgi:TonB family protein
MRFQKCLKTIIPLIAIFLFVFNVSGQKRPLNKNQEKPCNQNYGEGGGISGANEGSTSDFIFDEKSEVKYPLGTKPLIIISKPLAVYTKEAKNNCIEGKVILKVTFLASGKIGKIKVLSGLPLGLTKQAMEAAKKMKFEPALKNYKPIAITKTVQYTFTIY